MLVCTSCFLFCYYGVDGTYRIIGSSLRCECPKGCGHGFRNVIPA